MVVWGRTLKVDPDLMKFFSRMLSRAGSSSSPTSSNSKGRPRDRLSSSTERKYLLFRDVTWQRDTQEDRHTGRQTHRKTDTKEDRHTGR